MVYIENGFKIALLTQLKKQALINDVIPKQWKRTNDHEM